MYAELHCLSNYSFLQGASHPDELVERAALLGYEAIAITDECSYAGIVKAHVRAKELGIKLIIGSTFKLKYNSDRYIQVTLYARNKRAYSEISSLITRGRRRADKGAYQLTLRDLEHHSKYSLAIWHPCGHQQTDHDVGQYLTQRFDKRLWVGVCLTNQYEPQSVYHQHLAIAALFKCPLIATNKVLMHSAERKPLHDTLTSIRLRRPVYSLGTHSQKNAEHSLKAATELLALYPKQLLEETLNFSDQCKFSLDSIRYQYPKELVPAHYQASDYLRALTFDGAHQRYGKQIPDRVLKQIEHELTLIGELSYEYYFLTVHDIVAFARGQNILCQGRGSAANSAVCYCLFITEVNPATSDLLFERFISKERNEPPDIDVDFEHQRREEVIQYIYKKYGRERAALAATVITYRPRSAIRDVGFALNFDAALIEQITDKISWWDRSKEILNTLRSMQLGISDHALTIFVQLVSEILGFPRHLSQHVGGFIITQAATSELVPIENAAMPDRTIIQWDKNDIEALGLLKIDVLALGMLTAIHKMLDSYNQHSDKTITIADIPNECPATYQLLSEGESIGVFQVESRAQIAMLPRLKPRTFYDLVIQVAIVRPGPIQGDMVHPYLRRRNGREAVHYDNEAVKQVLERTLGVPIFQEQVIKLAMVAANFSPGEADQLRRAMAAWQRNGNLEPFKHKLLQGMLANGHSQDFAERLYRQMQGFGEYGFPESHAASFALLVYISAWFKCHHPAHFFCALLNSQPMGFYSRSQLIQDAARHGVTSLPVNVQKSQFESLVTDANTILLGFHNIKGLSLSTAQKITRCSNRHKIHDIASLQQEISLTRAEIDKLIEGNATFNISKHRFDANWQLLNRRDGILGIADQSVGEYQPRSPSALESMQDDYQHLGFTLNQHPLAYLRDRWPYRRCYQANTLHTLRHQQFVRVAGIVTCKQRPGSASGVLFLTLEDETGNINIVVWRKTQDTFRQELTKGRLLLIKGILEHADDAPGTTNVIAGHISVCDQDLPIDTRSRDFR